MSESCQLDKHTHVPFPKQLDYRTKFPFELVHTNVWSPSRTESTLGFRYFVTFINDYSHCTWLFLMKTKVELFSIFQKFHVEVRTQINTSICILRSDISFWTILLFFVLTWGILHQSSFLSLCLHKETFVPIAKMTTICTIMAITASHNWSLHQMDMKNVLLRRDLKEDVYIRPLVGLFSNSAFAVCKLRCSLYGLK